MIDPYHLKIYGKESVNYNRDVEAFEIIMGIAKHIIKPENIMTTYKSPTDMGISCAGFCISDDEIVSIASLEEIRRRKFRSQEVIDRGEGDPKWISKINELEQKCLQYCESQKYNIDLKLV